MTSEFKICVTHYFVFRMIAVRCVDFICQYCRVFILWYTPF